jgi:cell wall-associated NlpC family hydrolase
MKWTKRVMFRQNNRVIEKVKIILKNLCCILFLAGVVLFSACRTRTQIIPPAEPDAVPQEKQVSAKKERLVRTGFTIQAGAFSILDNAVKLTEKLNERGLNAYYFRHETGLYKVRFGDFLSLKAARREAKYLFDEAVIEDYFIVKPEDYAVSKRSVFGVDYLREKLVATAESFIGVEYAWGGTSRSDGFDCSGLTMAVYQMNGLNLPRSSKGQFEAGKAIEKNQLKRGDLLFFVTSNSHKISHVGIYSGDMMFIHAPGKHKKIRKDSLSDSYFQNRFAGACTYLE